MPSIGRGLPTRKAAPGKSSSSGSRRRSRGLPLASGGASESSSANSGTTSMRPSVLASSSSLSRRNHLSTGAKKKKVSSSKSNGSSNNNNSIIPSSDIANDVRNISAIKTEGGTHSPKRSPSPMTKEHPQILEAKLDKAGAIQINGNRSGSANWTIKIILNDRLFDPSSFMTSTCFNVRRVDDGDSDDNNSYRPRRHRTYSTDADANDMLGDEMDSTTPDKASSSSGGHKISSVKKIKGKDGNFHYCKVCNEVGDVVCCDGCPQVYHPQCLPVDSTSFAALDTQNDDAPWYCPDCVDNGTAERGHKAKLKKNKKRKANGSPSEIMSPYRQQRPKRKCSYDGNDLLTGEKTEKGMSDEDFGVAVAVEEDDTYEKEDDEINEAMLTSPKTPSKTNSRSRSPPNSAKKSSSSILSSSKKKSKNKKQRSNSVSTSRPTSPIRSSLPLVPKIDSITSSSKKKDKKKKKKKKGKEYPEDSERNSSSGSPGARENSSNDGGDDDKSGKGGMYSHLLNNNPAMVKAVPAFYFYLGENRNKIDRNLSRKHRYFNRLPKANMERNQLIAKEGIIQWQKLSDSEIQRYMQISMKDYERKIIEWKEEKTLRQMMSCHEEGDTVEEEPLASESDPNRDLLLEDERLTQDNHQRLYLSTTVGSKPYKPDLEESNNLILLELLQDTRFHPLPMMQANRPAREYGEMDFERVTIPYFDINGPVSTCLGDECLGCSRGWTHFCNVLKRRIPAVARRAKLQPPLSSLVATRIGLGLRNPPLASEEPEIENRDRNGIYSKSNGGIKKSSDCDVEPFSSRDIPSAAAAKALPHYPWEPLTDPTERADDVVRFVEEAVCMKIPEPPRHGEGTTDEDASKKRLSSSPLGLNFSSRRRKRFGSENGDDGDVEVTVKKCGRCRTIIEGDTGCVPCRRAQLVINMSRDEGQANDSSSNILRVQTNMLGRIVMRDGEVEAQNEGDESISNHILRQRWTPFAILPPATLTSPAPMIDNGGESGSDEEEGGSENDEDVEDEEIEEESSETDNPDSMEVTAEKEDDAPNTVSEDNMDTEGESSSTVNSEDDVFVRPKKRLRASTRIEALESNGATTNVSSTKVIDTNNRSVLIKKFKEEANAFYKKCVSISCHGLLLALTRRDPLLHFAEPVEAEGYHDIVQDPIDFGIIKKKVLRHQYPTLGAFVTDARLLCNNAMLYNPPDSIYYKTAKELSDVLTQMQKRASEWISTLKDAHAATFKNVFRPKSGGNTSSDNDGSYNSNGDSNDDEEETEKRAATPTQSATASPFLGGDPFVRLRREWPEAVEQFEDTDWLYQAVEADFMRTKENENAYYGCLAIRRAAAAASASLAPYTDSGGMFNTVGRRTCEEDEKLRNLIADKVGRTVTPPELKEIPTWREEMIMRVLRKSQARRMEGRMGSTHGCARCDGVKVADPDANKQMNAVTVRWGRTRKKPNEVPRIDKSRLGLSTGLGSQATRDRIQKHKSSDIRKGLRKGKLWALVAAADKVNEVAVTARGSRIHGMGLFADQPLQKGDVVAEYVGEYVSPAVTDAREKGYQKERIQDYQFRIDSQLVIDATKRGGHGRYANHNCDPNCATKIIPFSMPTPNGGGSSSSNNGDRNHNPGAATASAASGEGGSSNNNCNNNSKKNGSILKRVVIVAQRDIEPMEELTYDYQFPLEVNMNERIPCNCNSELCRGFMNWDLPEKGAKNQVFRTQKRGANMRDRIRRLGRPLKGDK